MIPEGYRVNPAYAPNLACPACGAMLMRLPQPFSVVSKAQVAADDDPVTRTESDGFKGVERTVGWRHTATLRCPRCDRLLSPAQADRRSFAESERPADFLLSASAGGSAEFLRGLADSLRSGRARQAPRAPEQGSLFSDGGAR